MAFENRFSLVDKNIIVTGGTGILGSLYVERLAEAGARVIAADLDQSRCDQLAQQINDKLQRDAVQGIAVNLSDESSVKAFAERVFESYEHIDVLINNAAAKSPNFFAPLESFPLDDWNQVMAVNVTGMFLTCREIGSRMAKRGKGSIINIGSIYGVVGPDQRIYEGSWYEDLGGAINTPLIYSATKGAVLSMTRYLSTYWGTLGVRTNSLTPGGVGSGQNGEFHQKYSARVPMGRMAEAEEMVGALIYLASDASSYVNGQNLIVDGGWTAW